MVGYKAWILGLLRGGSRRSALSEEELLASVSEYLSGTGGVLRSCSPIRSRIAGQTVDGPCEWFIPVMTTEACPRLVRINSSGGAHHVVVWDERHAHYLARLVEAFEACGRVRPDFDSAVRAFATIAFDFVLEQLNPNNHFARQSNEPERANRVLARMFSHCTDSRTRDQRILSALLDSPEVSDPGARKLLRLIVRRCRELTLDHEAHHYGRRRANEDYQFGAMDDIESIVLNLLSGFERVVTSGARPSGRLWSFFETLLNPVPTSFLRSKFEHTRLGEEIQSDLVPLMMLCVEVKSVALQSQCTEVTEFAAIAQCYQAGRVWQITTAFLAGLQIEVSRALGRSPRLTDFADSDLGLRLMLGNFMSYKVLTDPPHAPCSTTAPFLAHIENSRRIAQALPAMLGDSKDATARKHRALFLDDFERSHHSWLHMLNMVGLEVADRLRAAADPTGPVPPAPNFQRYLNFLGISTQPEVNRQCSI